MDEFEPALSGPALLFARPASRRPLSLVLFVAGLFNLHCLQTVGHPCNTNTFFVQCNLQPNLCIAPQHLSRR
jgi:hypothetical protein